MNRVLVVRPAQSQSWAMIGEMDPLFGSIKGCHMGVDVTSHLLKKFLSSQKKFLPHVALPDLFGPNNGSGSQDWILGLLFEPCLFFRAVAADAVNVT